MVNDLELPKDKKDTLIEKSRIYFEFQDFLVHKLNLMPDAVQRIYDKYTMTYVETKFEEAKGAIRAQVVNELNLPEDSPEVIEAVEDKWRAEGIKISFDDLMMEATTKFAVIQGFEKSEELVEAFKAIIEVNKILAGNPTSNIGLDKKG
jgi:hypothetical protein